MFDKNGLATKTFKTLVYNYNNEGEFNGSSYLQIEIGTGIPAQSTLIRPNDRKNGFTQVFNEEQQEWQYVEDHRYDEVYNIETKQKEDIKYLGKLKQEHTLLEPPSMDHEFIDGKWVITEAKKQGIAEREREAERAKIQAERAKLMQEMQYQMLIGNQEEAKEIAIKIKELDENIEAL